MCEQSSCFVWFVLCGMFINACLGQGILEFLNMLYKESSRDPREGSIPDVSAYDMDYDFIIVGAGSSGCVLANRLSEVEDWNVLLLEAGPDENFITDVPILAPLHSLTTRNWGFSSKPNNRACRGLRNGVCFLPAGKVLGGGSVLNFMIYARGNKADYDDWKAIGNPGWGYDDMLPYFKKSENVGIPALMESPYHGHGGNMDVQLSTKAFDSPLQEAFLESSKYFGYNITDPNGSEQLGFSKAQSTTRDGRRCSASKAFLEPARFRHNLHVSKRSRALKVLIDKATKRAYAVQFVKNGRRHTIRARKEIILTAGAFGSPQLLMLSGIGPADHLRDNGIEPILDLPVGKNLQDHVVLSGNVFFVDKPDATLNEITAASSGISYILGHEGPLTLPGGALGLAFMRSSYAAQNDNSSARPDLELVIGAGSLGGDFSGVLRSLLGIPDRWYSHMFANIPLDKAGASFAVNPVLVRGRSRGSVRLASPNPWRPPIIDSNFFDDPNDIEVLIEGAKMAVAVGTSAPFVKKFNTTYFDKPFLGCEGPWPGLHQLTSSKADKYWDCAIRSLATSLDHSAGTCQMAPKGVLDPRLRVYGARGLRVACASALPLLPTGHPHAIVTALAERAADLIKEDWADELDEAIFTKTDY